jgi:hypothetical protein
MEESASDIMVQNPQLVVLFFVICLLFLVLHLWIKFKLNKQLLITEKKSQIKHADPVMFQIFTPIYSHFHNDCLFLSIKKNCMIPNAENKE